MRGFLLWAAALAVLPACGGNVILDTSAGGKGGAGGSSSSGIGGFGGSTLTVAPQGPTQEVAVTVSSTSVATTDATTAVSSTFASSSSDFASSSTGGDPCSTGADCTQCPDKQSCFNCGEMIHPAGVADYHALAQCILCQACSSTCQSEVDPGSCEGPPPPMSPCDVSQPFHACTDCQECSIMPGALCAGEYDTCMTSSDCLALVALGSSCH